MEEAIVLYPSPPIGHLISMVELGKLLLTHQPSLSVHILITSVPYNSGSTSTNPHVREELLSISKNYTIHGLVVDFFCSAALSVAKELNIPAHYYFTSGAGVLSIFLYFPTIHNTTTKSLKDLKTLLHIPGVPPIPSTDMPVPLLEREDKAYEYFKYSSCRFPELSATEGPKDDAVTRNGTTLECLKWLDSQPVEEMKLALPMKESESGFVSATEVEERVRGLMESEEGQADQGANRWHENCSQGCIE
ncbi:UDP-GLYCOSYLTRANSFERASE 88A1-LIKE [Salix koriyanagi]|uniref:UDP-GLYCOSYLTRANSFERASE 88A1-LIKE n=1 Tax=Salix koriyanagi TaxID=2511006 RepID=A0A9Q0UYF3_9ROSI|nr:UDP-GLYCOSYLTRANSFERASE 88A1-LIKE [Salix koriyanagi]